MSQLQIYENPLDAKSVTIEQSDNVLKRFLEIKVKYKQARIYKDTPCPDNDVTPFDRVSALKLLDASPDDCFHVVCHAGDLISAVNFVVVKIFGAIVSALVKVPSIKNDTASGSSNNNLSDRENKQRIGQRVSDIYGKVKSIPDLIAPSYRVFQDGKEVEESFMCVGRGFYQVNINDVKEGDTRATEIDGSSFAIYEPNQSLISSTPQLHWGSAFDYAPLVTKKCNAINGQTLLPPTNSRIWAKDIYFEYPNKVKAETDGTKNQFSKFSSGEGIIIEGANYGIADASFTGSATVNPTTNKVTITAPEAAYFDTYTKLNVTSYLVNDPMAGQLDLAGLYSIAAITYMGGVYTITLDDPVSTNANFAAMTASNTSNIVAALTANEDGINLDGTYVVSSVDNANKLIYLVNPNTVNSDWDKLSDLTDQRTAAWLNMINLKGNQNNWIGWYTIDFESTTGLLLNFVARNGVYQGNAAKSVTIVAEYQRMVAGVPTGPVGTQEITLTGIGNNRDSIGGSMWIDLPFSGAVRFRAKRTTDNGDAADLSDETKFYLAYGYYESGKLQYDEVTLARVKTVATESALGADTREFNMIVHRKLHSWASGVGTSDPVVTNNFADIVCAVTTDERIGRRPIDTLDHVSLYETASEIEEYFGVPIQFNYTFDDASMSYEETLATIANAVFCDARRESNKVFFVFEKPQDIPVLLFNHRNKKPESEKRSVNFGVNKDYDGVKIKWNDPGDSWSESEIKIPFDTLRPKELDIKGLTNSKQATLLANRAWNRIKYQKRSVEFSAYHESDLVTRNDLILVADDTRPMLVSSGSVLEQDGLYVTLSQPCNLDVGTSYVIHLQMPNKQVDVIQVTQGDNEREVLLARAPISLLVLEYDGNISSSTYIVTTDANSKRDLFLITEKSGGSSESTITAINYTDNYYLNDNDYHP